MEVPIQVAVRLRPITNVNDMVCVQPAPYSNTIQLGNQYSFPVNYALPVDCSQSYLFLTTVNPLINSLLEGYDVSLVALGQTNSGKTYTILGPGLHCAYSEREHGIIPRFIREIFSRLAQYNDRNTNISITWSQICGENIQDLLGGNGSVEVCNVSDAFHWLQLGMNNLTPTHAHTLFTITIEQQWIVDSTIEHRISTASFADLTHGEKMLILDSMGETRTVPIDNGLLQLHNVITSLTDPYYECIPYNQSVLTTLLKDSFGGRAKTLVICCLSPLVRDFTETLFTLQFGMKIQCVRNCVTMNTYTNACTETVDNLGSEQESMDRSTYADTFGLQFAVSQWMKLVSNAEDLFTKLVSSKQLSELESEQISEWLLLKQECEECLSSEETISIEAIEPQRSLGRIDEETELDTTTPPNDLSESETESDMDPQRPDFLDKLDSFMQTFRMDTDHLVSEQCEDYLVNGFGLNTDFMRTRSCTPKEQLQAKGARGRRASIHPGDTLFPDNLIPKEAPSRFISTIEVETSLKHCTDPQIQIKTLTIVSETIQKKLKQVVTDLEQIQKQIDELQYTIVIKEKLIENMIENADTTSYAKQKFQKKRVKLEAQYYEARAQLAQAEINLLHCHAIEKQERKKNVEHYRRVAACYENRLKNIESIKVMTEDSARKVLESENTLHAFRKQMERLKKQLIKEEKRKQSLERELLEEQRKITNLAQQVMKETTQDVIKTKISIEQEKCSDLLERTDELDEKETLRHEIRNLRKIRDFLVEQRCQLDGKFKKQKMLSDNEERKLFECEEAIEAIDSAIEYKNELMCGEITEEQCERILMQILMKLSENEMRSLLNKYFQKVIDLRESGKKMEMQLVQLECKYEANVCKNLDIRHRLQQVRLENERRIALLQQQHEDQLNLMMKHFADETSASSDATDHKVNGHVMSKILERNQLCHVAGSSRQQIDRPLVKCRQDGRHERLVAKYTEEGREKNKFVAKIQEMTRFHTMIPHQNLKQLQQTTHDSPAMKVTRQKNKLIIQQSIPNK